MKNTKLGPFIDAKGIEHYPPENSKINWRISVYGLAIQDNKILFTKPNWSNKFELPGGSVEINESLLEALHREIKEETGLSVISVSDSPFYVHESNFYYYNEDTESYNHSIGLFYTVQTKVSDTLEHDNQIDKNILENKWIPVSEIGKIKMNEMTKMAIDKILP